MKQGRCRSADPVWFFGLSDPTFNPEVSYDQYYKVAQYYFCKVCPVAVACLEFAFESHETHGVFGGERPRDRKESREKWLAGKSLMQIVHERRMKTYQPKQVPCPKGHAARFVKFNAEDETGYCSRCSESFAL
jgi:hypothetical protein